MDKIIAVDFDGTLVKDEWPYIGAPKLDVIKKLKKEQKKGAKVILWTCRIGSCLLDAVDFCRAQGIRLDAVNENLTDIILGYGGDTRKIVADEYWDDRAIQIK